MNERSVFHGSPRQFEGDVALPKRNIRSNETGVVFDGQSFHATPHRWIALAYTYTQSTISVDGSEIEYAMGIDLYSDKKEVLICGVGSLEESLKVLYGKGGYIYHFGDTDFLYKEGLGTQEVIAQNPVKPITRERIENPVEEMRKLGVTFVYKDVR